MAVPAAKSTEYSINSLLLLIKILLALWLMVPFSEYIELLFDVTVTV